MNQNERWHIRYNEMKFFIEEHQRNPSKPVGEERNTYTFVKYSRKQMRQGLLKENRIEASAQTKTIILFFVFFIVVSTSCSVLLGGLINRKTVSPYDFGLLEAKSDIERFYVLEKTHKAAIATNADVSYKGIDSINIEIPEDANSIPLGNTTDFQGVIINIRNTSKDIRLFSAISPRKTIKLSGATIDSGIFKKVEELSNGSYLLLIEDENPWGDNRVGYEYAHKRKDILLIKNGYSVNRPIMPYDNKYSSPKCWYVELAGNPFILKNLTVNRLSDCEYKTFVLYVDGYNDVRIDNVIVTTQMPSKELMSDHVIRIHNSTNVSLTNTIIDGTYSLEDHSGYGYSLNNIWNFVAKNMYGRGNWGVFGSNNLSNTVLEQCDINRFDIHCYGRDCYFKNVNFVDKGNQFSSVFGTISFESCIFTDFTPLINRFSFNAFVGYELYFKDCIFNVTPSKKSLISMGEINDVINSRPELKYKCWPNIHIKNLTVNMTQGAREFNILYNKINGDILPEIHYINLIEIDGLSIFFTDDKPLKLLTIGTKEIKTINDIDFVLSNVEINGNKDTKSSQKLSQDANLIIKLPIKDGKVQLRNVNGLKFINNNKR